MLDAGRRMMLLLALLLAGPLLGGCASDDGWGDEDDSYEREAGPTYRGVSRRSGGGQGTHATGSRRDR